MFKFMFLVVMKLMEKLLVWLVDWFFLVYVYLVFGNIVKFGIYCLSEGLMVFKEKYGKIFILDVGILKLIKSG